MGIDPVEIRRRNFIQPDQYPYQTPGRGVSTTAATTRRRSTRRWSCRDYAGFAARRADERGARQAARPRPLDLDRGLRHRALEPRRPARRPRRPLRERDRPGERRPARSRCCTGSHSHGQGHETTFPQVVAEHARHRREADRHRPRRHRPDPVRHGHLRLALDRGRRQRDLQRHREDRRQGQEDRRPPDGGLRRRHRARRRQLHASRAPTSRSPGPT